MIIVKSPLRISLFGGSTDYESFYSEHGSFLIGTTIDKYVYLSMRLRPRIFSQESSIIYSKLQFVKNWEEIQNPLIKEIIKYKKVNVPIEFISFSDIPARTGLGGSSSFCVGMLYLINKTLDVVENRKQIVNDAIHIERVLLNEPGGIQDQIWPAYPGLNSIEIEKSGKFSVKPVPVSEDFLNELEQSMILVYTNSQREQDTIAGSHENKDKQHILQIAKEAHSKFIDEDIAGIGSLLYETWKEKSKISNLISNSLIDTIVRDVMSMGAYGTKLLGAGGCGFLLVLCNPIVKKSIVEKYRNEILDFRLENSGVSQIYP